MLIVIIRGIHLLFVLYVLFAPFINNQKSLMIYAIIIPFLYLHWITNNNTCALTTIEKYVRKEFNNSQEDCFTCKIINPVYDVHKDYAAYSAATYIITFILWSIVLYKLYNIGFKN